MPWRSYKDRYKSAAIIRPPRLNLKKYNIIVELIKLVNVVLQFTNGQLDMYTHNEHDYEHTHVFISEYIAPKSTLEMYWLLLIDHEHLWLQYIIVPPPPNVKGKWVLSNFQIIDLLVLLCALELLEHLNLLQPMHNWTLFGR